MLLISQTQGDKPWAVTRGDAAAVSTLLNYGADPKACNKLQETALNWAIEASDSSYTTLLLSHGAQPTVHSVFGQLLYIMPPGPKNLRLLPMSMPYFALAPIKTLEISAV